MFIQTTKIEIFATADKDTPTVSVDGAPVTLSGSSSWHIHTIKDVPLFKVKVTDKYYEILSESFGIYIIFNGDMLAVQVRKWPLCQRHQVILFSEEQRPLVITGTVRSSDERSG